MYIVDKENNQIDQIKKATFHELGFKEREHLQEWIAKNPSCLGEDLLIIQKEFHGFDETNERLDLLALDRNGNLVVIENKLDDTGKDVTWQALKYVSYCSTLTKQQVIDIYQQYLDHYTSEERAVDNLVSFFDDKPLEEISINDDDQRMILVAGSFRKEVTSTVMWMLNHNITIQCFKATPYQYGKDIILDIEQIIPVKEAEDYIIKMADKAKEKRETNETKSDLQQVRKRYWMELLEQYNQVYNEFQGINPSEEHYISCGSGVSGALFSFTATKTHASVEIYINHLDSTGNKKIYDLLYERKDIIEKLYSDTLTWQRLDSKRGCRITSILPNVNVLNEDDWSKMISFQCNAMKRFIQVIKPEIKKAMESLK